MRSFDHGDLAATWKSIAKNLDAQIFVSTWDYRGLWRGTNERGLPPTHNATVLHNAEDKIDPELIMARYDIERKHIVQDAYDDHKDRFIEDTTPAYNWRDALGHGYGLYRPRAYYSQYFRKYRGITHIKKFGDYDRFVISRPDIEVTGFSSDSFDNHDEHYAFYIDHASTAKGWWIQDLIFVADKKGASAVAEQPYTRWNEIMKRAQDDNTPGIFFEVHGTLKWLLVDNDIQMITYPFNTRIQR